MIVNHVLDIFMDPSESADDYTRIWLLVEDKDNRVGYLSLDFDKYPSFEKLSGTFSPSEQELALAEKLLRAADSINDFSKRPRLENASPALQALFDEMENADSITYFVSDKDRVWEDLGLSREEYENQIDGDIKKFGLDGIICKYNDEDALYTCYGDFLCSFTKSLGKDRELFNKDDGINEISSLSPDSSDPMVAVSFVPVIFQRDKDYPFRLCEIVDRSEHDTPCVSYFVIRDGKEEAAFTIRGDNVMRDHAYFSALDYIAGVYHDSPDLALEYFDGVEYIKKFYEISLFSNPALRLQYNPMMLDAYWRQELPDYSTQKVFADALINGELSVSMIKEIEKSFNSTLENPNFHVDMTLLSQLDSQPTISEVRNLDNSLDISDTPLYAAAQYEWEQERTRKIFDDTEKDLLPYLNALDTAMEKYGPTRASLDRFSDMLNDLCYGKEDKLREAGAPINALFGSPKNMETIYMNCHKVLKAFEQSFSLGNGAFR